MVRRVANRRRRKGRGRRRGGENRVTARAPVQVSVPMRPLTSPPVRFNNTEMITNVITDGNGFIGPDVYNCNCTETSVFPRLSQLVMQYQRCDWSRIVFQYTPSCATSTPGMIAMAFISDPEAETPETFAEIQALRGAVTGSAWSPLNLLVPKSDMNPTVKANVVQEDVSPTEPDRFTSCGQLVLAAEKSTASTTIGTLRVSYDATLSEPREVTAANAAACIYSFGTVLGGASPLPSGATNVLGLPPVYEKSGHWVKRSRAAMHMEAYLHGNAPNPIFSIAFDGVAIAPMSLYTTADNKVVVKWSIPKGDGIITITNSAVVCNSVHLFFYTIRRAF